MKAILLKRTGEPKVLDYADVPTPRPRDNEVLVKADTIGVSRPEILVRKGEYAWMPPLPVIPGIEMAGTVVERGAAVSEIDIGERVFVSARELPQRAGCYAEYIAVPAQAVFRLPAGIELEAAACLSNYQVAYHVLHTAARCVPGGWAVIDAAAGGVGSAAVELARLAGMRVVGVVGSPAKVKAITAFGAEHAVDYRSEDVAARVMELTDGHGGDLVLDSVGGRNFGRNFAMVAPFGLVVSYGKFEGYPPETLIADMARTHYSRSPAVRFFTMHTLDNRPEIRAESIGYLLSKLAEGAIRPLIHARLPLAEAWRAHEMLEAGEVVGKIVLKP
jgi:NADPH2:quinone reductase